MVVLPDHLHAVWTLPTDNADYALRWRLIKTRFSRALSPVERRSASRMAKNERGIWQRRYWEHEIRDALDMQRHVDYIHVNPVKHGYVSRAVDWPHSSIHRFIERGDLPERIGRVIAMESQWGKEHDDGYRCAQPSYLAYKLNTAILNEEWRDAGARNLRDYLRGGGAQDVCVGGCPQ